MKRYIFALLSITALFLTSCIEEVNIKDAFNIEPQIVLYGRVCPQADTNFVYLCNSSVFFSAQSGNKIQHIKNATVEISADEENWTRFLFHDSLSYYLPKEFFQFEEGSTYYIRASHNNYETVKSSCTIPIMHEVNLNIEQEVLPPDDYYTDECMLNKYSWSDFPNEENYYMLWNASVSRSISYSYDYENDVEIIDTTYFNSFRAIYDSDDLMCIFTDEGNDGKLMEITGYYCNFDVPEDFEVHENIGMLSFMMMDKSCYLYELSVDNYYNSVGVDLMTLFEPVIIYSNIENGLGLFGAFTIKKYSISELITTP